MVISNFTMSKGKLVIPNRTALHKYIDTGFTASVAWLASDLVQKNVLSNNSCSAAILAALKPCSAATIPCRILNLETMELLSSVPNHQAFCKKMDLGATGMDMA